MASIADSRGVGEGFVRTRDDGVLLTLREITTRFTLRSPMALLFAATKND